MISEEDSVELFVGREENGLLRTRIAAFETVSMGRGAGCEGEENNRALEKQC